MMVPHEKDCDMQLDAHKSAVAKAYGLASAGYNKPALKFFSQGAEALVDFAGLTRGQKILDVATGTGHAAMYAGLKVGAEHGLVVGIDIAEEMMHLANASANAFGSPNVLYANHLCGWHKSGSAQYTYGTGTPQPDYKHARCVLLWGYNPQASQPPDAARISRAKVRGATLIVIDPRKASVVDKADLWLRVRPGSDGALAMIHVLLEESLYDTAFVRVWTNGPFLVREDTQQLLTERDLTLAGHPEAFVAWDSRRAVPVAYHPERGYVQDGVDPALAGTYACTLADGTTVACRPVLALLQELAARYAPERSEALTWVPAADVRRAVRMFATEQPSCYVTGAGLEEHANATQTSRAVSLFYALTGQVDRCGSNVLFASTATNSLVGRGLLPKEQASRTLGYAERPLGQAGTAGQVTAYDMYRAILTAQPYPVKGLSTFRLLRKRPGWPRSQGTRNQSTMASTFCPSTQYPVWGCLRAFRDACRPHWLYQRLAAR
jgi:anaerobic selenocysteine-containing dehydrogenase